MMPQNANEEPPVETTPDDCDPLIAAVNSLANRTPEEKLADRAEAMKYLRKGRPLPEGKTLNDVVEGTWPGDETDEQIYEALKRLS